MKKVFFVTIISLLISCEKKDKYTILEAWLYNNSDHSILILPYNNGMVAANIRLNPNDSIQFGLSTDLGDITGPGFYSDYVDFETNPVMVIYDDSFSMAHYNNILDSTIKHYSFQSTRNILNPLSYQFSRIKDKKGVFTNMHKYRFTEQDYLDAKD